jgi:hypothetical protein
MGVVKLPRGTKNERAGLAEVVIVVKSGGIVTDGAEVGALWVITTPLVSNGVKSTLLRLALVDGGSELGRVAVERILEAVTTAGDDERAIVRVEASFVDVERKLMLSLKLTSEAASDEAAVVGAVAGVGAVGGGEPLADEEAVAVAADVVVSANEDCVGTIRVFTTYDMVVRVHDLHDVRSWLTALSGAWHEALAAGDDETADLRERTNDSPHSCAILVVIAVVPVIVEDEAVESIAVVRVVNRILSDQEFVSRAISLQADILQRAGESEGNKSETNKAKKEVDETHFE